MEKGNSSSIYEKMQKTIIDGCRSIARCLFIDIYA